MKYRSSEETSLCILSVLAENREYAQYDLHKHKEIEKDYHTVLRHLQALEKDKQIRFVRTEPGQKCGKERKIYEITFSGLILVLKKGLEPYRLIPFDKDHEETNREIEKAIDQTTVIHRDKIPLIFGKWDFFKENDVKDIIVKRFINAIWSSRLLPSLNGAREMEQKLSTIRIGHLSSKENEEFEIELHGKIEGRKRIKEISQYQKTIVENLKELYEERVSQRMRDLINKTFGILSVGFIDKRFKDEREESMFLLQVLRKDSDLKAYIDNELNEIEKEYAQYLANIKSWKQQLGIF
jgi:hypothetical protein